MLKHITTAFLAGALLLPSAALAQFSMCADRKEVIGQLQRAHKEHIRGAGTIGNAGIGEIYISEQGTWTMVVTLANGKSCIVAAGTDWDELPPPPKGQGL